MGPTIGLHTPVQEAIYLWVPKGPEDSQQHCHTASHRPSHETTCLCINAACGASLTAHQQRNTDYQRHYCPLSVSSTHQRIYSGPLAACLILIITVSLYPPNYKLHNLITAQYTRSSILTREAMVVQASHNPHLSWINAHHSNSNPHALCPTPHNRSHQNFRCSSNA